jgi:hypothetical protein
MFKFVPDAHGDGARLVADAVLTPEQFEEIAKKLRTHPIRARKIGFVAARKAAKSEVVETRDDGRETTNTARAGDFIVTNLSPQRTPLRDRAGHMNVYVIEAARFPELYEPAGGESAQGAIYRAKGVVSALPLPGGFDIAAPWGERQTAASGYLLYNGQEVYGSSKDAFEKTYEVEPPISRP